MNKKYIRVFFVLVTRLMIDKPKQFNEAVIAFLDKKNLLK